MIDPAEAIVARLEAMRVRAVGVVDDVVAGTSELPRAKIVD